MRLFGRNPRIHECAICCSYFKCCTWQFFLSGNIFFGYLYLNLFIVHNNMLHFQTVRECKGNCLRHGISTRCAVFCQGIGSSCKAFDPVRRFFRDPVFDHASFCISQRKLCTWQFAVSRNVPLCDFNLICLIADLHCITYLTVDLSVCINRDFIQIMRSIISRQRF